VRTLVEVLINGEERSFEYDQASQLVALQYPGSGIEMLLP